jgi:DNA invertase Pin-like site-specific DNA recombinase
VAYSYVRFSSPEQEQGDSLRRQTKAARLWCDRQEPPVRLDTSLQVDRGISAFRGKNADIGALGEFLRMVEGGRVRPGDYLVVESLDRLTREEVQAALRLVLNILAAGVRVVQLTPNEFIYDKQSDTVALILMIVELSRGHSESAVKSERVGAAWEEKRDARRRGEGQPARKVDKVSGMEILTHRLPGWVREVDGKAVEIPERADVVRRIFRMAAEGRGLILIAKRLNADGVPPFGEVVVRPGKTRSAVSGKWALTNLRRILTDRRACGVYTPGGKDGGEPIEGYYPRVVSDEEFDAVRVAMGRRAIPPGRARSLDERRVRREADRRRREKRKGTGSRERTMMVNVFAGLLRSARDGGSCFIKTRVDHGKPGKVLANTEGWEGRATNWSFPWSTFETLLLSCLREIDVREVLPPEEEGADECKALETEQERLEAQLERVEAAMESSEDITSLDRVATKLRGQLREVKDKLRDAQDKARHPRSAAWEEAKGLLGALGAAPDKTDARVRLRSALRRIVERISVLVVPRGRVRLCHVQIDFKGEPWRMTVDGERRTRQPYRCISIIHREALGGPHHRMPSLTWASSFKHPDDALAGLWEGLSDLNRPGDVEVMIDGLEVFPQDLIDRQLAIAAESGKAAGLI